jgi:hypothetical protein
MVLRKGGQIREGVCKMLQCGIGGEKEPGYARSTEDGTAQKSPDSACRICIKLLTKHVTARRYVSQPGFLGCELWYEHRVQTGNHLLTARFG